MNQEKIFNPEVIDRFDNLGGKAFIIKMIDTFLRTAQKRVDEAKSFHESGDLIALSKAAHALRSSAGNFEANAIVELSKEIEQSALEKKEYDIPPMLNRLERLFEQVKTELLEEKKKFES